MLEDFCNRFSVSTDEIHWHKMAIDPWAGPVYTTGYRSLSLHMNNRDYYMAGMFSRTNYPERSMEGSIRAGSEVAECIRTAEYPWSEPEVTVIIPVFNDLHSLEIAIPTIY